jgi:RNA-binding protein 5/10
VQSKPEVVTYEQTTSKNYTSPVMSKEKPIVVTSNSNDEIIDLVKMACLLCKRKFDSVEILNKHVAKSDLHKVNSEFNKKIFTEAMGD